MPTKNDEELYNDAVKWIDDNPDNKTILEDIKQDLLRFNTLSCENQSRLVRALKDLQTNMNLPEPINAWLSSYFKVLATEMMWNIGSRLTEEEKSKLILDRGMYNLFQSDRLSHNFLERVVNGQQDKVEKLFNDVLAGKVDKIQAALCYIGKFTDYSGRTFHCTAYEYVYFVGDMEMCRVLELFMDAKTKAFLFQRIQAMEIIDEETNRPFGLEYEQNGAKHRRDGFDFSPLKVALKFYIDGYDGWDNSGDVDAAKAALLGVGKCQRDVPAHIAQKYCDEEFFSSVSSFSAVGSVPPRRERPRVLTFSHGFNGICSWFPLGPSNADLGIKFSLVRGQINQCMSCFEFQASNRFVKQIARLDLAVITQLEDSIIRERQASKEYLNSPSSSPALQ